MEQVYQEQVHQQEAAPFCVNTSQRAHVLENIINKSDYSQIATMDKKESKPELEELLEELAHIDTAEEPATINKPWGLQEES